jgi:hypothetical protein
MRFRVTSAANLRAEPDKTSPVVIQLPAGAVVKGTGKKERHWVPVRHQGHPGWVADRHLERIHGNGEPDEPESGPVWSEADIVEIIREAARRHDQPVDDLVRVGRCESGLDPRAVNPAGPYHGLFQFLRTTWASTPFAERDIYDPVANANAAAWMWQQGRRGEWACQ